jgi:peptide/nickel transport system permease protein
LPNMLPLLASAFIGATIYAIAAQVGLEFLGLGDVEKVTWGTNLYWAANDAALLTGSWWTFVPTGASVALVGFALALVNGAIDEIGNPRLRVEKTAVGIPRIGAATPVLRRPRPEVRP